MTSNASFQFQGYSPKGTAALVNDTEIADPAFVRAVRNFSAGLPIKPSEGLDYAHDLNRDLKTFIVKDGLWAVELDMSPLEIDIEDEDLLEACKAEERLRDWFRTITTDVSERATPYVRREAWERFRLWATLLIASFPDHDWPRTVVSNDNFHAANDNSGFDDTGSRFPRSPRS